jgi:hypothetical protein
MDLKAQVDPNRMISRSLRQKINKETFELVNT